MKSRWDSSWIMLIFWMDSLIEAIPRLIVERFFRAGNSLDIGICVTLVWFPPCLLCRCGGGPISLWWNGKVVSVAAKSRWGYQGHSNTGRARAALSISATQRQPQAFANLLVLSGGRGPGYTISAGAICPAKNRLSVISTTGIPKRATYSPDLVELR